MKITFKKLSILLIAIAFILILAGSVNAATPTVETINGREMFFANGTPITIEANGTGALIKWEGDQKEVSSAAYIFGGMHDNNTEVNSSITMNGGNVKAVMGGGLHECNTKKSTVIINGGTINSVTGGGVGAGAAMAQTCPCGGYSATPADLKDSVTKTGTTNVTINGGNITLLYGAGSSGYTRTEIANLKITGGTVEYVTAGSSNGSTGTANLEITGGILSVVQSVNRGKLESANVEITGGTITDLYVCGENDSSITGEITGTVTMQVSGKANVSQMQTGRNAGSLVDTSTSTVAKAENIKIASGTVKNKDLLMLNGGATILNEVIIDGDCYLVEEGKTLKDLAEYNDIITKEGYKFVGFEWAQGEWNEEDELFSDLELTTVFEKIETSGVGEATPEPMSEEKDDTPKTGSIDLITSISAVLVLLSLVAIIVKKNNK